MTPRRHHLAACTLLAATLTLAAQTPADLQKELHKKEYRDVQAQLQNGVLTLSGSVRLLADKLDFEKKASKVQGVTSVQDQITVRAPENISDAELFQKIGKALTYDRVGYIAPGSGGLGDTAFNNINLAVQNGVVKISGIVCDPADKTSALGIITHTAGVQGLVDQLQVAPLSPNDWNIRRAAFQAIYGFPQLNKYAINPAKPIRILVLNGNITLVGVVDNQGDRNIAGIRANSVPGAFSVKNELQVQGQELQR